MTEKEREEIRKIVNETVEEEKRYRESLKIRGVSCWDWIIPIIFLALAIFVVCYGLHCINRL